jgi:hypothetical protein
MTMATTGWEGPYELRPENFNTKIGPGAYALGRNEAGTFYVDYVGRSDSDLINRLKSWVGSYPYFKGAYYATPYEAFLKECKLYHDFNPRDNKIHPDRAKNANWQCPCCNIFS